jgi:hypothetical protein
MIPASDDLGRRPDRRPPARDCYATRASGQTVPAWPGHLFVHSITKAKGLARRLRACLLRVINAGLADGPKDSRLWYIA